jgi:hypothetical protein
VLNNLGKGDGSMMHFAEGLIVGMMLITVILWFAGGLDE